MRRILAISMAAAIPAVLPVHAVDARTKPAPPPAAGTHARPAHRPGHHTHGRPAHAPVNDTYGRSTHRPENDVQISTDDPGTEDGQGAPAASNGHGTPGSHEAAGTHETPGTHEAAGTHQAPGSHQAAGTHQRPGSHRPASRPGKHTTSPSMPGTGADTGFSIPSDADSDMTMPAEAAAAIKEAGGLAGESAEQGTGQAGPSGQSQPGQPGEPGQGGEPGQAGQPGQAQEDKNTNVTSQPSGARLADAAAGSQLVLRTSGGASAGRSVTLRCDPPGGTHPKAAQACADVAKSHGDLAQLPAGANPRACFMIYAPVTATAQGAWHGEAVRFTTKFPNTCVMRDKTGSIFDF